MAVLKHNTLEGGTAGASLTTGNSGGDSGDAFSAVYTPTGCTWTYANGSHGNVCAQASLSSSAGGSLNWLLSGETQVYGRFRFRPVSGTFTGQQYLLTARLNSLANSGFSIRLNDSLQLRAMNRNGSGYPWTSTAALSVGTDYQIEWYVKRETSTGGTNGQWGIKLWSGDGGTLLDSGSGTNQDWNMFGAAATFDNITTGCQASSTSHVAHYDDLILDDAGWPGPVVDAPNEAPVAHAGSDTSVARSPSVSLSGAGSTDDGTIVAWEWEQISGPAGTIINADEQTATFIPPATTGTCVIQLTVTDDGDLTDTDTVTVTVAAPPGDAGAPVNAWDGDAWVPADTVLGWDGVEWVS